ncbi:3-methyl-2-oxobutanoate hydroxymethyltransferase [Thermobacillus xylanilyticus]|jgi:3-methyl-2-oxobutanoate hydroxymethyltransferase|uniref:3-methyl-2-oxobutanoate hydroxymethyltransferase n=1 Tax=Thermobacillus xylanilyticus TaxID=76633 RepID=A0ABM8V5C1_THEXY|nr:3-methyl-2-oxobutanoate hydroxymethyltransferase [Thermobacillus xylanilyticus]REJ20482.1 MAG: 3-methyl-2-oxobutanoate hydroxymethyltransferase [Paenibacillaceae bacterium]CAG5087073.1 3-methyl-2-oxobutanoate hydroxymethyltransferase [Thermobacillus xylanilyticus]
MQALTVTKWLQMKKDGIPISMVTAYDYPSARLAEEAGVDAILVGDSLGNVVLGYDTTLPVTLDDIIYHARAARRGAPDTFIVADLPFMTYRLGAESTLRNAGRLMQETGVQAVKLEGGADIAHEVSALTAAGIPVMGHIGLLPQSIHQIGGYKVQGKLEADIRRLIDDAKALEEAGAFAIVLELVTDGAAEAVTRALKIPTIGIGAGAACDGQVLVYHDMIRYASPYRSKKFVKTYADVGTTIRDAIGAYVRDVKARTFPGAEHSFPGASEIAAQLYGGGEAKQDAGH